MRMISCLRTITNTLASASELLMSLDKSRPGLNCCAVDGSVDCRSVSSASYNHNQATIQPLLPELYHCTVMRLFVVFSSILCKVQWLLMLLRQCDVCIWDADFIYDIIQTYLIIEQALHDAFSSGHWLVITPYTFFLCYMLHMCCKQKDSMKHPSQPTALLPTPSCMPLGLHSIQQVL